VGWSSFWLFFPHHTILNRPEAIKTVARLVTSKQNRKQKRYHSSK
jgi:hypothetical protein